MLIKDGLIKLDVAVYRMTSCVGHINKVVVMNSVVFPLQYFCTNQIRLDIVILISQRVLF